MPAKRHKRVGMGCAVSSPRPKRRTRAATSHTRRRDSIQVYETVQYHNYPSESVARHYYPIAQPDPGQPAIRRVSAASNDLRRTTSHRSRTSRIPKQVRIESAYEPPPEKRRVRRKPAHSALRNQTRTSNRDVRSYRTSPTRSSRRSTTRRSGRSGRSSRHPPSSSRTYGNSVSYIATDSSGRTLVEDNGHSDYWDWALGSHRFPLDRDEYRVLTVPSDVTSSGASRVGSNLFRPPAMLTNHKSSSSFYMSTPRKRTRARVPNYQYSVRRY